MSLSTCALCPRLCRSACPVTTGAAREAAVPGVIAGVLFDVERGRLPSTLVREAATLCTDCGACQEHCHLHVDLPAMIRDFRVKHVAAPPIEPLGAVEGVGDWLAVESDTRPLGRALAAELGVEVRVLKTSDDLGVDAMEYPGFDGRLERLRGLVGRSRVVVVSGGVAQVLQAAGIGFEWLHQVVRDLPSGESSCVLNGNRPLGCCGGAGPLRRSHPADAERVGALWLQRSADWAVRDARCRAHLERCGGDVSDPLDTLLERTGCL